MLNHCSRFDSSGLLGRKRCGSCSPKNLIWNSFAFFFRALHLFVDFNVLFCLVSFRFVFDIISAMTAMMQDSWSVKYFYRFNLSHYRRPFTPALAPATPISIYCMLCLNQRYTLMSFIGDFDVYVQNEKQELSESDSLSGVCVCGSFDVLINKFILFNLLACSLLLLEELFWTQFRKLQFEYICSMQFNWMFVIIFINIIIIISFHFFHTLSICCHRCCCRLIRICRFIHWIGYEKISIEAAQHDTFTTTLLRFLGGRFLTDVTKKE